MDVIELTQELVRIDSQNPVKNEKEIANFIKDFLEDLGLDTEISEFEEGRSSIICFLGKGDGLLFNGHIDTVPVVDGWNEDPFGGEIRGNKLFGLGSSDMKGGVAAMLSAFAKSSKEKFKRKILLTFVADEEVALRGSEHLLENRKDLFQDVKYGVVSEPSNLDILRAQKGIAFFKVIFSGKAAHGSRPKWGDNAIEKAGAFIEEIKKLQKELSKHKDEILGSATINIGKIKGGTKVNIVPNKCIVEIDRRLIPKETPDEARKQLEDILKKLNIDGEVKGWENKEPRLAMKTPENSRIIQEIMKIKEANIDFASGYTEAELYHRKVGIETIIFGPGRWDVIHCPDEYVEIDKLKEAESIYEKLIKNWCC